MFHLFVIVLRDLFRSRASLEAEIVALRQQIALLEQRRGARRVRLFWRDRMFRVFLSGVRPGWRTGLVIVRPETVLRWHRENPLWGAPRIHGELLMLGIDVCESLD